MTESRTVPTPPDAGLCPGCLSVHKVSSAKGSVFFRCNAAKMDPRFAKYPPQPVLSCFGYEPVDLEPRPGQSRE